MSVYGRANHDPVDFVEEFVNANDWQTKQDSQCLAAPFCW